MTIMFAYPLARALTLTMNLVLALARALTLTLTLTLIPTAMNCGKRYETVNHKH